MPHSFDFDSIDARLFALHHVALGSRAFCERFRVSRSTGAPLLEYEWHEYLGHLKALVSGTIIDAAVKIRMLQDFARREDEDFDWTALQASAIEELNIGTLETESVALSLRESCNKVVHAIGAKLDWQEVEDGAEAFEFWTGRYRLFGADQRAKEWVAVINVPDWCTAMMRYNKSFQNHIDWMHVLKWDE